MDERDESFADLLAASEATDGTRRKVAAGERLEARVVAIGADRAFLDVGATGEAEIGIAELRDPETGEITVQEGDTLQVTITDDGQRSGTIVCRLVAGRGGASEDELMDAFAAGIPVEGLVTGQNKGGYDVQIGAMRGFCPASQMDLRKQADPASHVGQRYQFKITKLQGGRDLVLSRRALLEAEQKAQEQGVLATLVPGAVVTGRVASLREFGAFVDLGAGIEGLVHVSELGHARNVKPEDVLAVGQEIEAKVLRLDRDPKSGRPRIGLSMRALAPDPWSVAAQQFPVGTQASGTVRKLEQFGAFVTLAPGIDGLIHVSRMVLGRRISHPRQAVEEGQQVSVTIVSCEPEKKRIGLSMVEEAKRAEARAADEERRETQQVIARERQQASLGTLGDLLKGIKR